MSRKTALILHETRHSETRVSVTPWAASMLQEIGLHVKVESGAGNFSGWSDNDYRAEGIEVVEPEPIIYQHSDFIIQVKRPARDKENRILKNLRPGSTILGFLDPQIPNRSHIAQYKSRQLTTFAWELLPKHKSTESFDAVTAMSRVTGMVVVDHFRQFANLQGLKGKRVLVLGLGNAGSSAAKQSLECGAHVIGMGTSFPEQLSIRGNRFHFIHIPQDNLHEQRKQIKNVLLSPRSSPDLVICSARRRYQNAPLLITKGLLDKLNKHTVFYDLTASSGGNCEGSKYGENVFIGNASIRSMTGYPKLKPQLSSLLYSDCVLRFMTRLLKDISLASDCLKSCLTINTCENPMRTDSSNYLDFESKTSKWIEELSASLDSYKSEEKMRLRREN